MSPSASSDPPPGGRAQAPEGAAAQSMARLQARWYDGLTGGLALSPAMFQIASPAVRVWSEDALRAFEDRLPPPSLTFDHAAAEPRSFSGEYLALAGQIEVAAPALASEIGEPLAREWRSYLAQLPSRPPGHQLPGLFRRWAIRRAPSMAAKGAVALSREALMRAPSPPASDRPPDFVGPYADLAQEAANAAAWTVGFDSRETSADVANTWTGGVDTAVIGLWPGAPREIDEAFAAGAVTVVARGAALVVWRVVPGAWYDSSLLNLAFSNRGVPPWRTASGWERFFGPGGSLRYLLASLVVVDGLSAAVTSSGAFDEAAKAAIERAAAGGLWPFFIPSGGAASNSVSFGPTAGVEIETVVQAGNPLVLGANVLGIAQYLGHAAG